MDNASQSSNLHSQAIDAALTQQWEQALKINKKIIKVDPQNIDALNRLAKAYIEIGKSNLAKKFYSQVLKIDPYNPIAQKNLKIMKSFKSNGQSFPIRPEADLIPCIKTRLSASLFLQEPGKTKVVNLLKVAEPQKLSHTFCGMQVKMIIKNRKITIVDTGENYLGVLPDDINHHLLRLLKGGNRYEAFIKSITVNSLSIIIKETFRSKRFKNQPSFLELSESSAATNLFTALDKASLDEETEEIEEEI